MSYLLIALEHVLVVLTFIISEHDHYQWNSVVTLNFCMGDFEG